MTGLLQRSTIMAHMKVWLKLAIAAFMVVGLSGCGLRAWVDVDITDDSSGTVTLQLQSDRELREGLATFSPDSDVVGELSTALAEQGWDIQDVAPDGEWEGVVATKSFADFAELSGLLDEATQSGGSSFLVVETDGAYRLSAELGPPGADENQAQLFAEAADVVDLDGRLTVSFPGEVTAANGDIQSDGSTVVWNYDESSIVGLTIEAEARKPSGLGRWTVLALVAVVAGGAAVALVLRRSKA